MGGAMLFLPVVLNLAALQTTVVHHAIRYDYPDPPAQRLAPQLVWHLFYLAVISLPLVLLKNKTLVGYSTALIVSAVMSHVYFWYAFTSVWCFFAALLSFYLAFLFHKWPLPETKNTALAVDEPR
jgi:hypothetical protein